MPFLSYGIDYEVGGVIETSYLLVEYQVHLNKVKYVTAIIHERISGLINILQISCLFILNDDDYGHSRLQ